MNVRFLLPMVLLLMSGCSATMHYQALGYFGEVDDGTARSFASEDECESSGLSNCTKILLTWETERYCGIYRSAEDSVSEKSMQVGTSPFKIIGWEDSDGKTLWLGDDENFERVDDEDVTVNSDILCGQFDPPARLIDVSDQEVLTLDIFCRPVRRGIALMPATATGYMLTVSATVAEKSWLGCRK